MRAERTQGGAGCGPLLCVVLLLAALPARAAEPGRGAEPADGAMEALVARYEAQQRRIAEIERSLAAGQDVEALRSEALRREIGALLADPEFREQLAPATMTAGYDKGFYIRSTDDGFLLRINGQLQERFTHYATRARNRYLQPRLERDDRTGFDIQRLRFMFGGHAFDRRLTYQITTDSGAANAYDMRLYYAWANYRIMDELQLKLGRFRLASTRMQVASDQNLQFIDRPMTDAVFGLGIGTGLRLWGQVADKRFDYFVDLANSLNAENGVVVTNDPAELDGNPALLARAVWHVTGSGADFESEADQPAHRDPVLDLGVHYAFNEDDGDARTTRVPFALPGYSSYLGLGGFGLANSSGARIQQFGLDGAFKYAGLSLQAEYMLRFVDIRQAWDEPYAPLWRLTGESSTTAMQGGYVQCGYFLPIPQLENQIEAVARVGGIVTNIGGREGSWEYAGGLNYYIRGQKLKIQTDVTKISEVPISNNNSSLANVNDDALIWRVQLQVLF